MLGPLGVMGELGARKDSLVGVNTAGITTQIVKKQPERT